MASKGRKQILRLVVRKKAQRNDEDDEQSLISRLSESNIVQKAKEWVNDGSFAAEKLVKSTEEAVKTLSKSKALKTAKRSAKKLVKSVGRSTWIFWATIFIVLISLIVEIERAKLFLRMRMSSSRPVRYLASRWFRLPRVFLFQAFVISFLIYVMWI